MSDLLEQLGITKDEMIERLCQKALGITADYVQTGEEKWEDVPFSDYIDRRIGKILDGVVEKLESQIHNRVEVLLAERLDSIFSAPIQKTNTWGEKIGEPKPIKDLIYDSAVSWWNQKVDTYGKPTTYHDAQTMAQFQAKKVMTEVYNTELVGEVKRMATELKAMIPKTIANEITETVVKHLK